MDPNVSSVPDAARGSSASESGIAEASDGSGGERTIGELDGPAASGSWSGVVIVAALLSLSVVVGGLFLDVPYVALVPGSARDTEPLLVVEGTDSYPSEGELLLTTVRLRQRPNVWEYLWLSMDSDAEVVAEERILEDRTPEENREFNLSKMEDSKQVAVAVALEALGYEAVSTDGVVVRQIIEETPAEDQLQLGDTILAIDELPTLSSEELVEVLTDKRSGDTVRLTVESFESGESREVDIELAAHPDPERSGQGFLGIQPESRRNYEGNVGFDVDIESGTVGGPSAGLAFTLAVLDQLTAGELTGGATVAVTGSIQPDGLVGPVGGVRQKVAAVEELGADAFIVPAALGEAELQAIFDRAGDDLKVLPVANLDEALAALDEIGGEVSAVSEYAASNTVAAG